MATTTHTDTNRNTDVAGRGLTIAAFILAGLALLFGLLAAIPGLICGIIAYRKGDPLAVWAIVANVVGGVAGWLIGLALLGGV